MYSIIRKWEQKPLCTILVSNDLLLIKLTTKQQKIISISPLDYIFKTMNELIFILFYKKIYIFTNNVSTLHEFTHTR